MAYPGDDLPQRGASTAESIHHFDQDLDAPVNWSLAHSSDQVLLGTMSTLIAKLLVVNL